MSGPGAGFEYPPQEVSWLKRDVLLFANSIGATADELHFLYVCRGVLVSVQKADVFRNSTQTSKSFPHTPSSFVRRTLFLSCRRNAIDNAI